MFGNLDADKRELTEVSRILTEINRIWGEMGRGAKARGLEIKGAIKLVRGEFSHYGKDMERIKRSLESNLGNTLGDIVTKTKSAKDAFKDMGNAIVQDIGRIITRMMAMQAVQMMTGGIGMMFAEGGIMPGRFMPITPMQHGGVYSRPTLGLIAEAGTPEAVVPLKRGGVPVEFKDKPKTERPTYIVNAFSEEFMQQQINKALSQNAEIIVNMVQQDIMAGGSTYQLIRGLR